ncbi:hypothetical protein B0J11DRAFT_264230 [Dendryphion nanum]|uniref:Uncharacterized protein n=1 Tax=Dendryphion nanum TaxID=256645 RepID=A0A9P9IMP6_9PLEO|nr:hypothetical protein B0J11DRAFT_264230 [Dendryphion nanum]
MDYRYWLDVRMRHDLTKYRRARAPHATLVADNILTDHNRILEIISECTAKIDEQFNLLEQTDAHMMKNIDPEWRWWTTVNSLNPETSEALQRRLDLDPPTEPIPWSVRCHDSIRNVLDELEIHEIPFRLDTRRGTFAERTLKEVHRLAEMHDPEAPGVALDLLMTFNTKVMHNRISDASGPWFEALLRKSELALVKILLKVRDWNAQTRPSKRTIWLDTAGKCQQIRSFAKEYVCSNLEMEKVPRALVSRKCYHDNMATTLEVLQKHAHTELRPSVYLAVGRKLPRELMDLVLEWTILIHEVAIDPVIFKPAIEDGEGFVVGDVRGVVRCGERELVVKTWEERHKSCGWRLCDCIRRKDLGM